VPSKTIYTIGHSTRSLEEFVGLLKSNDVHAIADVRRIPKSRRHPHFADILLASELPRRGIDYLAFTSLGGRRRGHKDSPNTGWRNESFRGYADFMQTPAFPSALHELMQQATKKPTAIMCAEAVPWRCHRSLISDALLVRGWKVLDIIGPAEPKGHQLTPFAHVNGITITYPSPDEPPTLFSNS